MADEWYDADDDVSRFLRSPGREAHLLDVSVPAAAQIHHTPVVMVEPPESMVLGFQSPAVDAGQYQAPPFVHGFEGAAVYAGQHQAPGAFALQATADGYAPSIGFTGPAMDIEHHTAPPPTVTVGGHTVPAFGYQVLLHGVDYESHEFGFDAEILGAEYHQEQEFGFPALNFDVGYNNQAWFGFQQAPSMVVGQNQAPAFGFQDALACDNEHHQSGK
jgi:hypothetical protein